MVEFSLLPAILGLLHAHLRTLSSDERGSPTIETVLIAAGLAALALTVVAIIVAKVTSAAHNIPNGQ